MNADEYQKLAMRTAATPDLFNNNVDGSMDDVLHALLGIGTEAGELQDMLKKHLMYGKAFDRTNLVEECGDLLWYIAFALKTVNVTMSDCMERNIKKLQVRYPQKFTTENALNRNLEQEARVLAPSAPAKPERVAVLRHRDHWAIYSDATDSGLGGSDDWTEELGTARLIRGRLYRLNTAGFCEAPDGTFTALIDWPPAPESADDKATRIGRELDPSPVVAALEPEPTRPALWEWVRAACVSRLGAGTTGTKDGAWALFFAANVAVSFEEGSALVHHGPRLHDERFIRPFDCRYGTPAELTAALNALADKET